MLNARLANDREIVLGDRASELGMFMYTIHRSRSLEG